MFVVKRPFKNFGKVYTVGSVIAEPTEIKRFKGKLAEGKIIEVTEQAYDDTAKYFKAKYNVDLPPINQPEPSRVIIEEPKAEEPKAKPVVKTTVVAKSK